ncbi:alkaline phosphatase [Paenibacillus cellulosilyticus]|uniref:Alkaline phosphatase n=1 Tax=Paenibacillus cellulosilyticus TaxID=375489 RepID=A0A2V2YYS5_9BACL|nr:alkaline phosphatase [Paenibacillus cellulosilyticus]PWV98462.1 alkaline phosphatase [Paenibacillus cellulosilyticus]QKS43304.1 alkaline phosphatase [Paenibacillus cellulosilyticus]
MKIHNGWKAAMLGTVAAALVITSYVSNGEGKQEADAASVHAKNVILFVGDGMGLAARDAIRLATVGETGKLAMDDMPYVGLFHTSSTVPVTDSAAAATAFASGVKTYNGAIGMDADKKSVKTILEYAKDLGKATGIVTTSQVTDATGAAFGAHVEDRSKQSDIALQYLTSSKVDVILGGGEDFWYPAGTAGAFQDEPTEDPTEKSKGTQGDLVKKAQQLGYKYVTSKADLQKASGSKLLGLFANEEMFQQKPEGEGDLYNPIVPLPDMTKKAIETLSSNKNGFFLVVEEEATDEMAHQNNAKLTIRSGQELDKAVRIAKNYAKAHPETLVLVLSDHETGGFSIEPVDENDESGDGISAEDGPFQIVGTKKNFVVDWTTSGHTAVDIPVTATGSRSELFSGVYENTDIFFKIAEAMGIKVKN